ncbi:MAG: hypothetical protein JRJ75_11830 [Deltaproteobacteria bacterium]|nr:hypothetical protein [Deltaproteobacteria bacterium]
MGNHQVAFVNCVTSFTFILTPFQEPFAAIEASLVRLGLVVVGYKG